MTTGINVLNKDAILKTTTTAFSLSLSLSLPIPLLCCVPPLNRGMKKSRQINTSMNENPFQGKIAFLFLFLNLEIVSMKLCFSFLHFNFVDIV